VAHALGVLLMLVAFSVPAFASPVTPDSIKALIDGNAMIIMFVVGILYTRIPALKGLTNQFTPWLNLVVYVVTQYLVPSAHAGVLNDMTGFGGLLWVTVRGGATSAVTSLLYDKFVKHWLDQWLPQAK